MYELPVKKEEKKPKNIPFKVHFGHKNLMGKSFVRVGLPLRTPNTVTGNISTKDQYNFEPELIEKEAQNLIMQSPRDKYNAPITENQKYGWYEHVKFTNIDKNDNRIYFRKRMDHLIKLYLVTMDKKT